MKPVTHLPTNEEGQVTMARESKSEIQVRESITKYLSPNETLCEFSWGTKEESLSLIYFFFGALGAAFDRGNQTSFFVGLTDKRLILVEVKRKIPTGAVYNIAISDIKGLQYRSSGTTGNLNIHLSADILKLMFDRRPWWSRAKNMAKIMPLQK
jgi:hypothetical protein